MKKYLIPTIILLLLSTIILTACSGMNNTNSQTTTNDSEGSPDNTTDGVLSSFTSTDVDGNAVDQSVFSGYKLTMVNIWATFCGPCIKEMPELGELNHEYADQGFQIIGIPVDIMDSKGAISQSMLKEAIDIINTTNADYLHIVPSASLIDAKLGSVYYVPETIFVDEYGRQVGESYIGSKTKAEWTKIIEQLLGEVS